MDLESLYLFDTITNHAITFTPCDASMVAVYDAVAWQFDWMCVPVCLLTMHQLLL